MQELRPPPGKQVLLMTYTTEQIKEMLAEITPGEWECSESFYTLFVGVKGKNTSVYQVLDGELYIKDEDARFIAAAPAIVRQLLAENERANAERETVSINIGILQQQNKQLLEKIEELEKQLNS